MAAATEAPIDTMLRRVQALLRQADHPNTSATEAQTFRNKAEALMMQYRIDEAMLAQQPDSGITPKWGSFTVCAYRSPYSNQYTSIARNVIDHCGARGVVDSNTCGGSWDQYDLWTVEATFVGFESDIRLVEALYTECFLAFQSRLEPKVDRTKTDGDNIRRLRQSGMEWNRITRLLWNEEEHRFIVRARRLFLKECAAVGESPDDFLGMGNNMRVFRESYAAGFASELRYRLQAMRASRGETSQGVVLAGREEAINEAFYKKYPQYAPPKRLPVAETEEEGAEGGASVARQHTREVYVDPRESCAKCQKAKSGYCRDHAYMRPSTARYREAPYSYAGEALGRRAARSIDLGSGSGRSTLR